MGNVLNTQLMSVQSHQLDEKWFTCFLKNIENLESMDIVFNLYIKG